jgi:alpha-beta hydrolase superfamily lysophospholipase
MAAMLCALLVTGDGVGWRRAAEGLPALAEAAAFELPGYRDLYGLDRASSSHRAGWLWTGHQRIVAQRFDVPEAEGTALVVHGYLDHTGTQAPLIAALNAVGWSVLAIDWPGHGLSPGRRASLVHFSRYRAALRVAVDALVSDHTLPPPYAAIGHSTGAAVLLDAVLIDGLPEFQRVVLLAPLIRWANWRLSRLAHGLLGGLFESVPRAFRNTTHDPTFKRFRRLLDPLQPARIPLDWARVMARQAEVVIGRSPVQRAVVVIQGTGDRTVDWVYNMAALNRLLPNASRLIIEGARHHLQHETAAFSAPLFERLKSLMAGVRKK